MIQTKVPTLANPYIELFFVVIDLDLSPTIPLRYPEYGISSDNLCVNNVIKVQDVKFKLFLFLKKLYDLLYS